MESDVRAHTYVRVNTQQWIVHTWHVGRGISGILAGAPHFRPSLRYTDSTIALLVRYTDCQKSPGFVIHQIGLRDLCAGFILRHHLFSLDMLRCTTAARWRLAASRHVGASVTTAAAATSKPPRSLLTHDIDPETAICTGGLAIITEAPGKGYGAFALGDIAAGTALVHYDGEVYLGMKELHLRYGRDGVIPFRLGRNGATDADVAWHKQWSEERRRRGVGVTGHYVFQVGIDHSSGTVVMVDAEDSQHPDSSWARFVNHSSDHPNVTTKAELQPSKGAGLVPLVRLITSRPVQAGEELLYDYGGTMHDFVEASY